MQFVLIKVNCVQCFFFLVLYWPNRVYRLILTFPSIAMFVYNVKRQNNNVPMSNFLRLMTNVLNVIQNNDVYGLYEECLHFEQSGFFTTKMNFCCCFFCFVWTKIMMCCIFKLLNGNEKKHHINLMTTDTEMIWRVN